LNSLPVSTAFHALGRIQRLDCGLSAPALFRNFRGQSQHAVLEFCLDLRRIDFLRKVNGSEEHPRRKFTHVYGTHAVFVPVLGVDKEIIGSWGSMLACSIPSRVQ
jgi:hypothetical protein